MAVNEALYTSIITALNEQQVTLVAVSKTKPVEDILNLYNLGQRDFGENYVQELEGKQNALPKDIRWHFIGHLQSNKVKYIAPFVYLIHGVDSYKLLQEINKQGIKQNRVLNVLLQMHIAEEETKFGLDEKELAHIITLLKNEPMTNVVIKGLMGMASFTDNQEQIKKEFAFLKTSYDKYVGVKNQNLQFQILSMGMSADYKLAIEQGSTMVRIGSLLFGNRK